MPEITFLGVGGALAAHPADNHTALLVETDAAALLLDCGPTIMRQLERVGLDAGRPTHVYLSHQHGDHILGLPMLLLNRVLFFPDRPLIVLAMPAVLDVAQELVALVYPDLAQRMQMQITFMPLAEDVDALVWPGVAGLLYRLARGRHSAPTWALRLDWSTGPSMVYSADTGPSPAIAQLAAGVDLLVHDAYYALADNAGLPFHSGAAEVGQIAAQAGVRAVALVHRQDAEPASAALYRDEAGRWFAGQIMTPDAQDRWLF